MARALGYIQDARTSTIGLGFAPQDAGLVAEKMSSFLSVGGPIHDGVSKPRVEEVDVAGQQMVIERVVKTIGLIANWAAPVTFALPSIEVYRTTAPSMKGQVARPGTEMTQESAMTSKIECHFHPYVVGGEWSDLLEQSAGQGDTVNTKLLARFLKSGEYDLMQHIFERICDAFRKADFAQQIDAPGLLHSYLTTNELARLYLLAAGLYNQRSEMLIVVPSHIRFKNNSMVDINGGKRQPLEVSVRERVSGIATTGVDVTVTQYDPNMLPPQHLCTTEGRVIHPISDFLQNAISVSGGTNSRKQINLTNFFPEGTDPLAYILAYAASPLPANANIEIKKIYETFCGFAQIHKGYAAYDGSEGEAPADEKEKVATMTALKRWAKGEDVEIPSALQMQWLLRDIYTNAGKNIKYLLSQGWYPGVICILGELRIGSGVAYVIYDNDKPTLLPKPMRNASGGNKFVESNRNQKAFDMAVLPPNSQNSCQNIQHAVLNGEKTREGATNVDLHYVHLLVPSDAELESTLMNAFAREMQNNYKAGDYIVMGIPFVDHNSTTHFSIASQMHHVDVVNTKSPETTNLYEVLATQFSQLVKQSLDQERPTITDSVQQTRLYPHHLHQAMPVQIGQTKLEPPEDSYGYVARHTYVSKSNETFVL